jgi:hypothetical protein
MNYSYRNYIEINGRSHVSATRKMSHQRIALKENNTKYDSDDAAIVSMQVHTLMKWT